MPPATSALHAFLQRHRAAPGCARDGPGAITHTSLGEPRGAFSVPPHAVQHFLDLYRAALSEGAALHITERHATVGPVVVDIDLRQRGPRRVYTAQTVTDVVRAMCCSLAGLVARRHMVVYVLEKGDAPRASPSKPPAAVTYKDGLHLVMPDVVTAPQVQHMARKRFIEDHGELLSSLPEIVNPLQDIVDEAVIERNGWFMYGSRKPGEPSSWAVTRRCRVDCETGEVVDLPLDDGAPEDLVRRLSIRYSGAEECEYTDAYRRALACESMVSCPSALSNTLGNTRSSTPSLVSSRSTATACASGADADSEPAQARALVRLLRPERADGYGDWMRVGWCLYNIQPSQCMLAAWEQFSAQSPKFKPRECPALWVMMGKRSGEQPRLRAGSLHRWAQQDDPAGYQSLVGGMRFTQASTVTWDVLQRSTTLHTYAVVKAVFERSHFKVMHPVCYACDEQHGGGGGPGLVIREEAKLRAAYRNLYCSMESSAEGAATTRRVPFVKVWLDDPLIRTYHSMDFMPPPLQCPPSVYNMWRGLAVDHLPCAEEGEGDADAASAQPFLDHVKLLAGGEEAAADYLVKWLAHLVQRPGELNSVAVILKSLQGCGKNILLDGMRLILGDDLFFETANPEQDVFGRFAAGRKNRLLVNIDESGALRFVGQMKNMLTSSTLNYEQKGVDPITLRNFNRVIITTNLDLPCKVEADDRRYVMFECSPARRGDKAYFDGFARYLRDPRNQAAIAAQLRAVDLSAVNWMADRPVSELYREARYDCLDLVLRFMEALHLSKCADAHEEHRVHGGPLFALFTDWLRQTNHPTATWNSTNFGRRMGEYVKTSGGAVTKTADGARRAVYAFHRARMEGFLAARGLLIGRGHAIDT